jgi:ABC-type multidrug transport system ATPase subunit
MTTAPPAIETRGLSKRFGSRAAVRDVSLTVPAGCVFGFLGHNGAGKTTVIRMLVGLTGCAPTPRACASGSASPAACWPTRSS